MRAAAPAVVPVGVSNWTGFYIGAHGGGGWNTWSGMDPTEAGAGWSSVNGSGGVAGGQIGGNYQINNFVVGLEGTYAWSNIGLTNNGPFGGGGGFTLTLTNDYIATVAGRLGVAFNNVLFYGKGGAAFTRDKYDANNGLAGALAGSASGSFDRTCNYRQNQQTEHIIEHSRAENDPCLTRRQLAEIFKDARRDTDTCCT